MLPVSCANYLGLGFSALNNTLIFIEWHSHGLRVCPEVAVETWGSLDKFYTQWSRKTIVWLRRRLVWKPQPTRAHHLVSVFTLCSATVCCEQGRLAHDPQTPWWLLVYRLENWSVQWISMSNHCTKTKSQQDRGLREDRPVKDSQKRKSRYLGL